MHGEPAVRDAESGYYNAAVLDFDGNSIEVVHRENANANANDPTGAEAPGRGEGSRVLTWQQDVARSFADGRSVLSAGAVGGTRTVANRSPAPPTVVVSSPQPVANTQQGGDAGAKAIIGTLLGAAAGAAVAYAMTKSEDSSAPQSPSQSATMPALAAAAQSIYRAIEAAPSQTPQRQYQATVRSQAPTTILLQDLELEPHYESADSAVYPTRSSQASRSPSQRPRTALRAIEAPPQQTQTQAQSVVARSTLINTFVPPSEIPRLRPAAPPAGIKSETQLSVRAAPQSQHSRHSASRPATVVRAASTQDIPSAPAPRSLVGSVLGLGAMNNSRGGGGDDEASVAPSDSVSQAGSKKHRPRSHHSHSHSHSHSESKSKSRAGAGSNANSRHSSTSRSRPAAGSRHGSSASTATRSKRGGGESVVRGEVEEVSSPSSENEDRRSQASSQRTVRPGDVGGGAGKKGSVASVPAGSGRTASRVGGGGGDKDRSVVSLGLAGMGMGMGIGKGAGSSVESRAGGARGWA